MGHETNRYSWVNGFESGIGILRIVVPGGRKFLKFKWIDKLPNSLSWKKKFVKFYVVFQREFTMNLPQIQPGQSKLASCMERWTVGGWRDTPHMQWIPNNKNNSWINSSWALSHERIDAQIWFPVNVWHNGLCNMQRQF